MGGASQRTARVLSSFLGPGGGGGVALNSEDFAKSAWRDIIHIKMHFFEFW